MAVGYRSSSRTGQADAFGSSVNVPVPSGAAADDIAVVALEQWETANPTVTAPAGFIALTPVVSGSQKLKVWWKRLTAGDTGNYTFSWSGSQWSQGQCVLFTGAVTSGDPIGSNVNTATGASGTSVPNTSVAVAFTPGLAHFIANENAASKTPPTSHTEVQDADYLETNYRLPGTTGSFTATGATTSASTLKLALLLALEPAGAGGTDLNLTDPTVGGLEAGATVDSISIGRVLNDTTAGVRGRAPVETLSAGLTFVDPTVGAVRFGNTTGETATTALVLTDSVVAGVRAGSVDDVLVIDVLHRDIPGGIRTGATRDTAAAGLALTDTAGASRLGATFGETATAALTVLDLDVGHVRLGAVIGETAVVGTGLPDPTVGGVRLGATTGGLVYALLFTDTPSPVRIGSATGSLTADVVLVDAAGSASAGGAVDTLVAAGPVVFASMGSHDRPGPTMAIARRSGPTITTAPRLGPTMTEVT